MTLIRTACVALLLVAGSCASAQVSLQSAVNLALRNSPRLRMAQAELDKARAMRGEAKDAYVPVVVTQAGYGQSTGAPLGVPVVFSLSAQSLIFSYSQRDTLRATKASVEAAEHLFRKEQMDVVEDVTTTYLALDNALQRHKVVQDESAVAQRLVSITDDRVAAGVDANVEVPKAHRTATQIKLVALQVSDEVAYNARHLATLTGLPETGLVTDSASIPRWEVPAVIAQGAAAAGDGEGVAAVYSAAKAKLYLAFADRRYLFRPQVSLAANYSRVDAGLSSYASYYPRFFGTATQPNSENSLSFGLQITVPLLDLAHRSRSRQSAAEAVRALAEADLQRGNFRDGRAKLQNAAVELQLRADLAGDEREIAQDQIETLRIQLQADAGATQGPQANPKDLLSAQLQERQRSLDLLNVQLQLRQTQVNLLRQRESLETWVLGGAGNAPSTPATPTNTVLPVPATRP